MAEDEEDIDVDIDIDIDIDGEAPEDDAASNRSSGAIHGNGATSMASIRVDPKDDIVEKRHGTTHGKEASAAAAGTDTKNVNLSSGDLDSSFADEYQIPDWVTQDYHAQAGFDTGGMDEKSRAMIESMLAEEEFYSGRSSGAPFTFYGQTTSSPSESKPSEPGSQLTSILSNISDAKAWTSDSRLNAKLSSADLPSHNTRWTPEEDARLRQGISVHGYGNWKAIAAIVGTRNPLQVKNHARHLAMTEKIPHDISTNTSDGEALDRRSSAANSAEEDGGARRNRKRRSRSKNIKRIDASVGMESDGDLSYEINSRRARSITSESGNDDFTGSEFGATSGYDTDNDEDRSTSKSPSLSARGGSRSDSAGLTTPSPGLRPLFPSLPMPYTISAQRIAAYSMDEDEDVDVDIESTDEETAARLSLTRNLQPFVNKSKSRSISPFSNSSTRSRLSSEFDSDSDRNPDNDDGDDIVGSGSVRKRSSASSPALSDFLGSSSDLYNTPNFNTSTSSINSTGAGGIFKPLLKDSQFTQQQHQQYQQYQQHQQHQQKGSGLLGHISTEKMANSPKERRTVSFGAVHVAELQPDLNSYDEDEVNSSDDGGADAASSSTIDILNTPSQLSNPSYQHRVSSRMPQSDQLLPHSPHPSLGENNLSKSPTLQFATQDSSSAIKRYSKEAHGLQETDDDGDEDEGSLGTGVKRNFNSAEAPTLSRKVRRAGSSGHSFSTGRSVSFQQPSPTLSPTQTSISPALTTITPSVTRRILDKSIITEEEKQVHSEFFCNKASKTPERYQRIRNTILQAWEKSPSTYLTKTSVRSGLKDCGDVNAIGRVHSWLESIGAINVGMTASSPGASLARPRNGGNNSSKRRGYSEERGWSSSSSSSAPRRIHNDITTELDDLNSVWVTPPLRRRRVRNEKGEWVDERELGGRVIEHNVHITKNGKPGTQFSTRTDASDDLFKLDEAVFLERHGITKEEMEEELEQERLAALNAKYFASTEVLPVNTRVPKHRRAQHLLRQTRGFHEYEGDEGSSGGYDPFRLIPLHKYNVQNPAPFRVKVSSDAMTEVIGLLGGLYDEDERILFILGVYPCRSISTGLQCEMDPESDVEARYFFSSKGFVVVGWYHSHPTFEPNPSIRDIENQCEHQAMFRRHGTGVEPFVGVIVSPFDPRNLSFLSKFQFLTVSEEFDENLSCRLPFGFDREITRTNELSVSVFQQLSEIVRHYRTHQHRVDLSKPLRKGETATRLDKLLQSLNHHIFVDENAGGAFLSKVRELVVRGFHLVVNHHDQHGSSMSASALAAPSSLPSSTSITSSAFSTANGTH
ncbi:Myb-like, SWIRM and MPN domains 1 [Gamsiella multidivaricata]|nr:Myb-like, SWIRM and MPN domains 1 [Gamsiella multidivaricata]